MRTYKKTVVEIGDNDALEVRDIWGRSVNIHFQDEGGDYPNLVVEANAPMINFVGKHKAPGEGDTWVDEGVDDHVDNQITLFM